MKKSLQSMLGVTLLEIMLVLAIASMVIIMSIRYYQSASTNQKINAAMNTVTGIVAAGESVLGATGSVATAANIIPYLPNGTMPNSPWGGPVTIEAGPANAYVIGMAAGGETVCMQLANLLLQNGKFNPVTCTNGTIAVTVNS